MALKQKRLGGFNRAVLREECGEILATDANRITLILGIMVCCTPLMLFLMLSTTFEGVLIPMLGEKAQWVYAVLPPILMLFFVLPLWAGLFFMASEMEARRRAYLSDVFWSFSGGGEYLSALRCSWALFWRVGVLWWTWQAGMELFSRLGNGRILILALGAIPLLLFSVLWIRFSLRGFFGVYRVFCRPSEMRRMRPYARSLGLGYLRMYLPWLLLSLLTVGILFLADTLPGMLVSYFRLCRKLNEKTTQSEELIQ